MIVPVSDQEKALEFYTGTLGFEKRARHAVRAGRSVARGGAAAGAATTIALVQAQSKRDPSRSASRPTNADADHAGLRARASTAIAEVLRFGGGVPPMFTFRDPDGNRFRMVERD